MCWREVVMYADDGPSYVQEYIEEVPCDDEPELEFDPLDEPPEWLLYSQQED